MEPNRPVPLFLNTLPRALRHYEQVLGAEVLGAGADWRHASVEVAGEPAARKVAALLRLIRVFVTLGMSRRTVVSIWPAVGFLDVVFWRLIPGRGRRVVFIHDPEPLRRSWGYGPTSARLARLALGDRVQIAVHTHLAAEALRAKGLHAASVVPHPVARRPVARRPAARSVLVAGQFKDARDTELMEKLAQALGPDWHLVVRGAGWPQIPGWEVESRFLSESELEHELASAGAVLIPYRHYFQSGIAVRSVECGTPVVARRHEFIEQLLGTDWPGLVDGAAAMSEWVRAAHAVAGHGVPGSRVDAGSGEWLRLAGATGEA